MSDTIPTRAAAEACDTNPRTLRIFLRASKDYEAVGSGGRYAFTEDDLPELKTRFTTWAKERDAAQAAKDKAAAEAQASKTTDEKAATPAPGPTATDDKPATTRTRKAAPAKATDAA